MTKNSERIKTSTTKTLKYFIFLVRNNHLKFYWASAFAPGANINKGTQNSDKIDSCSLTSGYALYCATQCEKLTD